MRRTIVNKMTTLLNPRTNEVFFCEDMKNIHTVDGVDFIFVRREGKPSQHLMRKDSLVPVKK